MKKHILVVGIVFLFVMMSFTSISGNQINENIVTRFYKGNTLYVGGSGEGNYTRIQDAVDNASDGDTIYVYDDSSPYWGYIIIDKSINLIGENRKTTVIDGYGSDVVLIGGSDGVYLHGFTLRSWSGWSNTGVIIRSDNNTITGNIVKYTGRGLSLEYDSNNNTIMDNIIKISGRGISLSHDSNNNAIIGNTILDTDKGIYLKDSSNNTILKNNFIRNDRHAFSIKSRNVWENNYWNRPRILPKLIFGKIKEDIDIQWINIDWHPAKEPNNWTPTQGCAIE